MNAKFLPDLFLWLSKLAVFYCAFFVRFLCLHWEVFYLAALYGAEWMRKVAFFYGMAFYTRHFIRYRRLKKAVWAVLVPAPIPRHWWFPSMTNQHCIFFEWIFFCVCVVRLTREVSACVQAFYILHFSETIRSNLIFELCKGWLFTPHIDVESCAGTYVCTCRLVMACITKFLLLCNCSLHSQ